MSDLSTFNGGPGARLKDTFLWGDTRLFELAYGLQLLARLVYGKMMNGYPGFMMAFGIVIAAYVVFSAVSDNMTHRHRSASLIMVFYIVYVYTAAQTLDFPAAKTAYYTFNMILPALYLKWRIYREKLHREQQR